MTTPATALTDKERREQARACIDALSTFLQIPWADRSREQWLQMSEYYGRLSALCEAQYSTPDEREEFD